MSYTCTTERDGMYVKVTRHETLDEARLAVMRAAAIMSGTLEAAACTMMEPGETLRLSGGKIKLGAE